MKILFIICVIIIAVLSFVVIPFILDDEALFHPSHFIEKNGNTLVLKRTIVIEIDNKGYVGSTLTFPKGSVIRYE